MRSAAKRRRIKTRLRQHARDARDMGRLATVRGAGQRKLLVAKSVTIGGAGFDERQGLQRLDGRTRQDRRRDIADGKHRRSVGIGNRDGAAMAALHHRPAKNFDKNRIAHF
jgi:hypothetical protein